jgi:hypothetical protein
VPSAEKLMDPDERVRHQVLKSFRSVINSHPGILNQKTLDEIAERCRDKKAGPRLEAISLLAEEYALNLKIDRAEIGSDIESYSWIPGIILEMRYLNDQETKYLKLT